MTYRLTFRSCRDACGVLLLAGTAVAGWSGFPIESNTTYYTWPPLWSNAHPVIQIYSALVERCEVTGVAAPELVDTWPCYAGTSNYVDGTKTNIYILSTNVTTTNQFTPFEYTVSGNTYTGMPFLTRAYLYALYSKVEALAPYFVCTNEATAGADPYFDDWFAKTNGSGEYPSDFPMESVAGLFSRAEIGQTTNLTTNGWGFVSGGTAKWTAWPAYSLPGLGTNAAGTFFTLGTPSPGNVPRRGFRRMFDEMYHALNRMKWTRMVWNSADFDWIQGAGDETSYFEGAGDDTTWGGAKTAAEANWDWFTWPSAEGWFMMWSMGFRSATNTYNAAAGSAWAKVAITNQSTTIPHAHHLYALADIGITDSTNAVFDAFFEDVRENQYTLCATIAETNLVAMETIVLGATNKPLTWCAEPVDIGGVADDPTVRGHRVDFGTVLTKHNFEYE